MNEEDVQARLALALLRIAENDRHLLVVDISERCIASRLAMYLQNEFPDHHVDIEYNRDADTPKRLGIPEACANYVGPDGRALVVPDVIVHRRGADGPNVLILELKKTTNPEPRDCDLARVVAFKQQFGYSYGALIECETRNGNEPGIAISAWV
jgi:hypothetical protein